MIEWIVDEKLEARLPVEILRDGDEPFEIDAVIDTGFSGYMTLAPELIENLELPYWETEMYTLGDGKDVAFNVHIAEVRFGDDLRQIPILATEGGSLIGMKMLKGYHLSVEVVEDGIVQVAPVH